MLSVVEALLNVRLCERFELVYGTSTGAIIGSMVALGDDVETIWNRYRRLAPAVMRPRFARRRSARLRSLASDIYQERKFDAFQTRVGIVTSKVEPHEPMIFKSHEDQLLTPSPQFEPGFGATIADAVVASCSAQPFFKEFELNLGRLGKRTLVDGGHMANNPTLLALIDTLHSPHVRAADRVRVLSVGTGAFPERKRFLHGTAYWCSPKYRRFLILLKSSTRTMEWLNDVLFGHIHSVRINGARTDDGFRTSLQETNRNRLEKLYSAGVEDAVNEMPRLRTLFGIGDPE